MEGTQGIPKIKKKPLPEGLKELPKDKGLFSIKQAAEYLSMRPSTLYQWIHEGRIGSVKIGGRRLIRKNDLEKLINKNYEPANPIWQELEEMQWK